MRSVGRKSLWLLIAALMLVIAPAWAGFQPSSAPMDPALQEKIAADERGMVVFVHAKDASASENAVQQSGLQLIQTFTKVGVSAAVGDASQVRRAAQLPSVTYLEADKAVSFQMTSSHQATRGKEVLDGFTEGAQTSAPLDGSGVSIAVLDSGIDGTHPMFQENGQSKVVKNLKITCHHLLTACTGPEGNANETVWLDLTHAGNNTDSPSGGHGTHVAGTAGGVHVTTSDGRQLHGAATGAKLVGLSVGTLLSLYGTNAGLNWILEHHAAPCGTPSAACPPIKVVNNSWGSSGGPHNPDSLTSKLSNALVAAGVTVVFSAGNGDTLNNGGTGEDNRVNPHAQNPTPGVIAVANYDDEGTGTRNGKLDSSSSRGKSGDPTTYPDISAPGTDITSACRPHLPICTSADKDPDYGTISGTSMAAPHISGIVAQLLEADPSLTPGDIEDLLEDNAFKFTFGAAYEADPRNDDSTTSFDKGHGLVDVKEAVAELRNISLPTETPTATVPFSCEPGGDLVQDPEGDTWVLRVTTNYAPPRDSNLDIVAGSMAWDSAAQALTTTYKLSDLQEQNAPTVPIAGYNANFYLDETRYFVEGLRAADGSETFRWGVWVENQARLVLGPITGDFDPANDTLSLTLTNANLAAAGETNRFNSGDELNTIEFITRRAVSTDVTSAGLVGDTADATCLYKIGTGPVTPPPPPAPGRDGALGDAGTFSWTAGPFTQANSTILLGELPCSSPSDSRCDLTRLAVTVPAGGANLKVAIEADIPAADFDMFLFGPDGNVIDKSQNELTLGEVVEAHVTQSGTYTIAVNPYLAAGASYTGTATLVAGAAPPPPSAEFDGEISSGGSYAWSGSIIPNPLFYCQSFGMLLCDNEYVKVNVPAGGATLTVVVTPDDQEDLLGCSVHVYDPDGDRIAESSFTGGVITINQAVTKSGVYRIGIATSSTIQDYNATASLS